MWQDGKSVGALEIRVERRRADAAGGGRWLMIQVEEYITSELETFDIIPSGWCPSFFSPFPLD